jgi:hypothetical protein
VTVAPNGAHAAIRADAQVLWTPPRSPTFYQSAGVTSADISATGLQDHPDVRRHLDATATRRLASLFNGLSVDNRGSHGCPADSGFRLDGRFAGSISFDVNPACGSVAVTSGHQQVGLLNNGPFYGALLDELGLPRNTH